MNSKTCFALSPLALAMITLSAHTGSTRFRTDFNADGNLLGANYIEEGGEEGGGDPAAVDTNAASAGASTEEQALQQTQTANTAPQAGTSDVKAAESEPVGEAKAAVGEPAAGAEQQT